MRAGLGCCEGKKPPSEEVHPPRLSSQPSAAGLGLCVAPLPAPRRAPLQPHRRCPPSSTSHHCCSGAAHQGHSPPQNRVSPYLGDEPTVLARLRRWVPGAGRGHGSGVQQHSPPRAQASLPSSTAGPQGEQGLQTPNNPQPPLHSLALSPSTHLAKDSLTRVQPGPGAGLAADHCPGAPC